jgi:hypothetical protein
LFSAFYLQTKYFETSACARKSETVHIVPIVLYSTACHNSTFQQHIMTKTNIQQCSRMKVCQKQQGVIKASHDIASKTVKMLKWPILQNQMCLTYAVCKSPNLWNVEVVMEVKITVCCSGLLYPVDLLVDTSIFEKHTQKNNTVKSWTCSL